MAKECSVKNGLQLVEIANFTTRNYRGEIGNNNYDQAFYVYTDANVGSNIEANEVFIFINNKKYYKGKLNERITFPATLYTTAEISIRVRSQLVKAITHIDFKDSTCIGTVNFLQSFPITNYIDTFNNCTSLKSMPHILMVDDHARNFSRMFRNCYMLEDIPAIRMLVDIDADYMFANTINASNSSFEQFPTMDSIPLFSSAVGMYYNAQIFMPPKGSFNLCTNLNNFLAYANSTADISEYKICDMDIPSATQINSMFSNTKNLLTVNFTGTDKVLEMNDIFNNNTTVKTITGLNNATPNKTIGSFYNASGLTSLCDINFASSNYTISTFKNCSSITSFNTLNFNNIIDLSSCFEGCSGLSTIPNLTSINKAERANSTFKNCTGLTTISELNMPACKNMSSICSNCTGLTTLPQITGIDYNLLDASYAFKNCTSASSFPNSYNMPKVLTGVYMFANDKALTSFPQLISTVMNDKSGMFMNCTGLITGETTFDMVENASYMFYGCTGLTNITASSTSNTTVNVKNLAHMFENCTSLVSEPDCLDTSNALNLNCLFKNCTSLESVELTTTTVETMNGTFDGCYNLNTLVINGTKCPSFSINGCNFNRTNLNSLIASLPTNTNTEFNIVDARNNPDIDIMTARDIEVAYNKKWKIKPYTYEHISELDSSITVEMNRGYTLSETDGSVIYSDDDKDFGFNGYEFIKLEPGFSYSVSTTNINIKIALFDPDFNFRNILKSTGTETLYRFTLYSTSYVRICCNGVENCDTVTITAVGTVAM